MRLRLTVSVLLLLTCIHAARAEETLSILPTPPVAKQALQGSPMIAVAYQQLALDRSQGDQYRVGKHEWILNSTLQQRRVLGAETFHEQDVTIAKSWRWMGKAGVDRAMDAQTKTAAQFAFEDAWHEAGRALLAGWFVWLRCDADVRLLEAQLTYARDQLAVVKKRVDVGDAPSVDLQLAQSDVDRAATALVKAQQALVEAAIALNRDFPNLPLVASRDLVPAPPPTEDESTAITNVVTSNHEIELAEANAELAKLAAQRARLDRIPDPSIGVRYASERGGDEKIAGLVFSVPLPGRVRETAYQSAQASAQRAVRMSEQTRAKVTSEARSVVANERATYKASQLLTALSERARAAADTVSRGYSLGEFSFTETQLARRQATEAASAATRAQLDALEAHARVQLDSHKLWALDDSVSSGL